MLKKLSIATACVIAVYGLVKFVSRHVVVVADPGVLSPSEHAGDTSPLERAANNEHIPQDVSTAVTATRTAENEQSAFGVAVMAVKPADPAGEPLCA